MRRVNVLAYMVFYTTLKRWRLLTPKKLKMRNHLKLKTISPKKIEGY